MDLIRRGSRGEAVRDVQHRLLAAGFQVDADELEGTYGASTESAVRSFQRARALPSDGIIGPYTWEQLVETGYRLGDRTLYLRSPAFRGDDVRELQRLLNVLGFDAGKEDGILGPGTDRALREFQHNVASTADGIVGLETVRSIARYRPAVEAPSRAVVREGEAARGAGLAVAGAVLAIDADRADIDDDDVSLAIAREVAARLERVGARPSLLRNDSEPIPVAERIRRANVAEAAALISVAVGTGQQAERGSVWFYYGTPSTHSPMGRRLAESIQEAVVRALRVADGGLHPRSSAILRETRMPAVRLEPVVASHPADAALLAGPTFAQAVARAVVDGVLTFARPSADPAHSSRSGSGIGAATEHQHDQSQDDPEGGRRGGPPDLSLGRQHHGSHRRWRAGWRARSLERLALQGFRRSQRTGQGALVRRLARPRADDLRDDPLEVVRRPELDHDLPSPLAHLDRNPRRELLREQLLDLAQRVLGCVGNRRELGRSIRLGRVLEVGADQLLDLPNREILGGDPEGERSLGLGVPEREQRASVARLDPSLGEERLDVRRELEQSDRVRDVGPGHAQTLGERL